MTETVRRSSYDPYRNLNYQYDGSAVRIPEEEEILRPRPQVRPRNQELSRPKVAVRPAGKVSLFAVAGFGAVAALAVMILMSYVQLTTISNTVVSLNSEMTQLQSEEATLRARYELAYDLGTIEKAVTSDGSMSRPQAGQMVYVDLTEPDSVVLYDQGGTSGSFLDSLEEIVGTILSYF
jgi:hypothetical protein